MTKKKATPNVTRSEWFDRLHKVFEGESDRAAAIVAASMVEAALGQVFERYLLPVESGARRLRVKFFGEAIGAAEQLGLISTQFARDLSTIADIRNYFAHEPYEASFKDSEIVGLVERLKGAHLASRPDLDWLRVGGERGDYLLCASWMLWSLNSVADETVSPKRAVPEFGYRTREERLKAQRRGQAMND